VKGAEYMNQGTGSAKHGARSVEQGRGLGSGFGAKSRAHGDRWCEMRIKT